MNLVGERSNSAFDIRHRLSIAAIYDVPLVPQLEERRDARPARRLAVEHDHHRTDRLRRGDRPEC